MQAMELSRAPVIASHSAARAISDVTRNMDDEQLLALKDNGGVIQICAFDHFVRPQPEARNEARQQLAQRFGIGAGANVSPDVRKQFVKAWTEVKMTDWADYLPRVSEFVDHIDYAVAKIGIDHVGISSDFGGGGGIIGWNNAHETLNVTLELARRGYSEADIQKLWSGNLLRVMRIAESVAAN